MKYNDVMFNPKGDMFPFFRNYLIEKGILDDSIDVIVDGREPKEHVIELKKRNYNITVKNLDVGDYLFEGGIAFERKKLDFTNIKDVIQKAMELKQAYKYPYLIVEGDLRNVLSGKLIYGRTPKFVVEKQIDGMISSLVVRGMTPIFCSDKENFFNIMDGIVRKHLDGKNREGDYKIDGFRVATDEDYTKALYVNLPDIGSSIADSLQEYYPSMKDLMEASIEELMEIEGIGQKRAEKIYNILRGIK